VFVAYDRVVQCPASSRANPWIKALMIVQTRISKLDDILFIKISGSVTISGSIMRKDINNLLKLLRISKG